MLPCENCAIMNGPPRCIQHRDSPHHAMEEIAMAGPKFIPLAERFARFVLKSNPGSCWLWTGSIDGRGYGKIYKRGEGPILAHRTAWEIAHGFIPDGLLVLHRCDNPRCVNIAHLFLGTHLDNVRDMLGKGRDRMVGERNHRVKLTADIIREIRMSRETGIAIAKRLGVTSKTISCVRGRKVWKHII